MTYTKTTTAGTSELITRNSNGRIALGGIDDRHKRDLIAEFILNKYPNEHTQKGIVADLRQFATWLSKTPWQGCLRGRCARTRAIPEASGDSRLQSRIDQPEAILPKSFLSLSTRGGGQRYERRPLFEAH